MFKLIQRLFELAAKYEQDPYKDAFWMDVCLDRIYERNFELGEYYSRQIPTYWVDGLTC